ncbi:5'-AMP-activated protein kinase beta subunit, interation domain-containing protein [Cubamyces menziesii]|nr:5'-AMP-activated protein kinase beta subunit, interation domain-containing protein [Cubamyces menziesii]
MGNTSSNPSAANARLDSPSRNTHSPIRGGSPNPSSTSHRVHRSLRHKKRSLELPDLASLTLTPASSSPASSPHPAHRRPRASSPIPIPTSANPPPQTFRPQNNLPSAARIDRMKDGRSRYKSSLSAFNSTRSFQSAAIPDSPPRSDVPLRQEFVPEVVHSTIPLALLKAEGDTHEPEPVKYKITWRGHGKKVYLIRAGHDNWQGRQAMEYDSQSGTFWTIVPLLPGTHHFKFIVDDQIRLTNDYPRAVDDRDGTLANYVAVTAPPKDGSPTHQTSTSPTPNLLQQQSQQQPNHQNSFWSDSTNTGGTSGKGKEAEWTTEIPPELIAAAAEEEAYLARADSPTSSASGIPTPHIPPAPALPRHLDKLILNVRPVMAGPALGAAASSSSERDKRRSMRDRERSRRDRGRDGDSRSRPANLGMTSADLQANAVDDGHARANGVAAPPPPLNLPVVTASGTDVTAMLTHQQPSGPPTPPAAQARPWDGPGVSDDASVLPVPSHVVLHHLSTSAIRNGVLAVANTTRYRKKYITTIYYKPT